jgi:hypothetical protein
MMSRERGGALFIVLLAIAMLAVLTWAVAKQDRGASTTTLNATQMDTQVNLLLGQGALLAGAVQQMVANGADTTKIYTTDVTYGLNTVTPGGTPPTGYGAWDDSSTSPNALKIYHPYGGGVKYMSQTGTGASLSDTANVANNFLISKGSIVKGVGPTDTAGDILFTAVVSSSAACQRINSRLTGSSTLGVVADASYTALFTNGTNTTLANGSTCTSGCDNAARQCVRNVSDNAYGYYQVLLPQ